MNRKKNQAEFAASLDRRLSGLQGDPWLARRIMANEEEKRPVVRKISASMVLVTAVIVLSLSAAYALARPAVLSWLLGYDDETNEPLDSITQPVYSENSADHITVRITGLVWDGERFVASYELENSQPDQPAMIVVDSQLSVNGQPEGLESSTGNTADPQIVPSPRLDILPVRRNPTDGGVWSLPFCQEMNGTVTCEMNFIIYRPAKGFVVVNDPDDGMYHLDEYDEESQAELLDVWHTLNSFQLSAMETGDWDDIQKWIDEGYTVIDRGGAILGEYDEFSDLLYNMQVSCQIPVTFHFDAVSSDVYDFSDMADVALQDCILCVHKLRFSPLTTVVDISLIPETNSQEAAQDLVSRYGDMILLNELGEPVDYSSMDYLSSCEPWVTENWHGNGRWACTYQLEMPGLQSWPQRIDISTKGGKLLCIEMEADERP